MAARNSAASQGGGELPLSIAVETIRNFIQCVASRRTLVVRNAELLVSEGFPHSTENITWNSVFDGTELSIQQIIDLEIRGEEAALLTDPKYSWVLTFFDCRNITLRDITFGHVSAGYCQGSVLRFRNCCSVDEIAKQRVLLRAASLLSGRLTPMR